MRTVLSFFVFCAVAGPVAADILEWRDEKGGVHLTNVPEEIPKDRRSTARVVVAEPDRAGTEDDQVAASPAPRRRTRKPKSEPARQAQVIYDRPLPSAGYEEGVRRGWELGRAAGEATAGGAPLPTSNARAAVPDVVGVPYPYLPPTCGARIGSGFDGGRSRHRTLRLAQQESCRTVGSTAWYPPTAYPPVLVVAPPLPNVSRPAAPLPGGVGRRAR